MKLFVIGATGRTGQETVQQALDRGHQVTAFVRSPESIALKNERLSVSKGNATDENQLFEAMQNHDAVISTLGPREVFKPSDRLFSQIVAVDVITAELWMAVLIYGAGFTTKIDRFLKADSSQIDHVKNDLEKAQLTNQKTPGTKDFIYLCAVGLGATGLAHWLAEKITPYLSTNYPSLEKYSLTSSFFWITGLVTLMGIIKQVLV